jgi:hypothetical protein
LITHKENNHLRKAISLIKHKRTKQEEERLLVQLKEKANEMPDPKQRHLIMDLLGANGK